MSTDLSGKIRTYTSDDIDVQYSLKRCIHAAECVKRLGSVFDTAKKPWIQPGEASADAVAETILHCPTGALHYERKDGGDAEPAPAANDLQIVENGPLYVRGSVKIVASDGSVLLEDNRVALCRCGASNNKPLCDNSHLRAGFEARDNLAANLSQPTEVDEVDGAQTLVVSPAPDGPLHLTGRFTLHSTDGETVFMGDETWLCRCGGSKNKPFCDGTHREIDFATE